MSQPNSMTLNMDTPKKRTKKPYRHPMHLAQSGTNPVVENKMAAPDIEKLGKSHPVLTLLMAREDPGAYVRAHLEEFVDYEVRNGLNGRVPFVLSAFFTDYVNFLVVRYLRLYRGAYGKRHFKWNIQDTLDKLSKLAYLDRVKNDRITDTVLRKLLPPDALNDKDKEEGGEIVINLMHKAAPPDLELRTFGLLEQEEIPNKRIIFRFRENCVQEFLVARYMAGEGLRKVRSGRSSHYGVSSSMRESMRRLPEDGDIWRMTFGLLNQEPLTRELLKDVMIVIIEEAKNLPGMTPFDITSLCVEAIYESQNACALAELLDEFTLNESIRYSNEYLRPDRLPYAVSAVGYLVRASEDVYGVHMSQFGLGSENIGMLADHVNHVSDNNLQVLNLSYNPLGLDGMKGLLRFLVKATLLTHLDLTSCDLGDQGVALMSEFFMCLPLRYLRLTENNIGDLGLCRMVPNLRFIPTLEWVDLSENEITDKSAVKLGEALVGLPNLRSLDLRRNKIGDEGVDSVSRSLAQLNQVTRLMLSDNCIGQKGASRLSANLWKTKSLRFVNLSLNNIPAEGIMGLRRAANSHGSLRIQVSGTKNSVDDALNMSAAPSEGEFMITPLDDVEVTMMDGDDLAHDGSLLRHPGEAGDDLADLSASVDLLAGRSHDFDRTKVHRRSWARPTRASFRRSWHGVPTSVRDTSRKEDGSQAEK